MNQEIRAIINAYVADYPRLKHTSTTWKIPEIGFASAQDPRFALLKESVRATHLEPIELLPTGQGVVAFFLPFDEIVAKSNCSGHFSSKEWAQAYIETNQLIADLSLHLIQYFNNQGFEAATVAATHNFDEETLMSDWSHRHIAEICGVGGFGLNNMLITPQGCAGRIGSVVVSKPFESIETRQEDYCLYYKNGSCGICKKKCSVDAFGQTYDRFKCYELLLENDRHHEDLGLVDVCGKCCSGLPCTYRNPCETSK